MFLWPCLNPLLPSLDLIMISLSLLHSLNPCFLVRLRSPILNPRPYDHSHSPRGFPKGSQTEHHHICSCKMATMFRILIITALLMLSALAAPTDTDLPALISDEANPTYEHVFPATGCFSCGQGVKRADSVIAANAICNYYYGLTLYQSGWGSDGVGFV